MNIKIILVNFFNYRVTSFNVRIVDDNNVKDLDAIRVHKEVFRVNLL